jgi:transposase
MVNLKKFIWLVSYPKSGNTWVRLFLHALQNNASLESLNKIDSTNGIASSRFIADEYLGVESSELPDKIIQTLRPQIFVKWAENLQDDAIVKVHDAAFHNGTFTFPKEVTKNIILIVRNPFDMAASYANHMQISIEKAIVALCNGHNSLAKNNKKLNNQLTQYMGSWSDFYNSWKNAYRNDLHIVKYEDLKNNPLETFTKIVEILNWNYSKEQRSAAIQAVEFDKLKNLEDKKGFKEKPTHTKNFFRKGEVGGWRNEITTEQANLLINRHFYTLLELGYIDENGNILV